MPFAPVFDGGGAARRTAAATGPKDARNGSAISAIYDATKAETKVKTRADGDDSMLNAKRIFWLGVILFFGGFGIPMVIFPVAKRMGISAEAEEQLRNSLFFIGLLTATLGGIPLALVGIFLKARKIK